MHRTVGCGLLFVLFSFVGFGARAQPSISPRPSLSETVAIESVNDVLVGKAQGRLNMRYDPHRSGPMTGAIFGNRIEGYRTLDKVSKAQSVAFIQFKPNAAGTDVATNVYVADYSTTERTWIGVSYAIDVALGGASATRNATPFRTNGPLSVLCSHDPVCVARHNQLTPLPPVQTPIAIDAATMAGFGIDAGGQRGPLVLRAGAGGNNEGVLSGHVLGDALKGHYARNAGTIVLLRQQGGRPVQVFAGVMDAGGIKGGRGYPLAGVGGNPFVWHVVTNDQIVSGLGSLHARGRCLTPDNLTRGGILSTTTACSNAIWVVFAIGTQAGDTLYSLVSVATGFCLQMPGTGGNAVVQQICNGAVRQSLRIGDVQQIGTQVGQPIWGAIAVNTAAAFGLSSHALQLKAPGPSDGCLAIVGSTGAVTESPCFEAPTRIMAPDIPNSKAGWTHDP